MNRRDVLKATIAGIVSLVGSTAKANTQIPPGYSFSNRVKLGDGWWNIFTKRGMKKVPVILEPKTLKPVRLQHPILVEEIIGINDNGQFKVFPIVVIDSPLQ